MRRLPRILLNLATLLSLAVSVLAVVLWIRGAWTTDYVGYALSRSARVGVRSSAGEALVWWWTATKPQTYERGGWTTAHEGHRSDVAEWQDMHGQTVGPRFFRVGYSQVISGETNYRYTLIPLWAVALPAACPAAARAYIWQRRRRRRQLVAAGRCPTCGYDLRATPDRCPECGSMGVADT